MKWVVGITTAWIAAAILGVGLFAQVARANPSAFSAGAKTAPASTTVAFMTAGNSTTTLVYDTYQVNGTNQAQQGNNFYANAALLKIQYTASSSALSVLRWRYEVSDDNVDWYALQPGITGSQTATTSPLGIFSSTADQQWTFASTSQGAAIVSATNNRALTAIPLTIPARYLRVLFFVPPGASAGGVYAEIIPVKETK